MPVFEDVTRALVRELNPRGDLTPLDSLIDFKHFRPFCLVLRKRKSTLFWGARYVRTDYTLLDVLEPGSSPSGQPLTQSWALKDAVGPGPAILTTRKIIKLFSLIWLGVTKPRVLSSSAVLMSRGGGCSQFTASIFSLPQIQHSLAILALRICWMSE